MRGVVKYINPKNGLCAIEVDTNTFTIFQNSKGNLSVGDLVIGNLESTGFETLYNESQKEPIDGCVENYDCTENQLRAQLRI